MSIVEVSDEVIAASVREVPRAMAFLSVEWSGPERAGRPCFREAVARANELGLEVTGFLFDEESDVCRQWLQSLGLPCPLDGQVPRGWGTVIWLEFGRPVHWIVCAYHARTIGLLEVVHSLWP